MRPTETDMLAPLLRRLSRTATALIFCLAFAGTLFGQVPDDGGPQQRVTIGAFVNDIQALNLREHSYAMDIYLWFRWKGFEFDPNDTVETVNPSELWGQVKEPQYPQPVELPSGEYYQVVRIQGRFSHKFLFDNYPYDRQVLTAEFEDKVRELNRLKFIVDQESVALHPKLVLPGFRMNPPQLIVEDFQYPTTFGDTRQKVPDRYSRIRIEIPIRRPLLTSTLKMLLPVLCVVLGASLMLRLKVTWVDSRIGIGITALLTVVAIQLAANDAMPNVDYLVLMDKIHLVAYAYVLVGLGVVLATVRHVDNDSIERGERFQRRAYWIATLLFLTTNSVMIANAIIRG
jgi:hypothetical protein